MDGWMDGWMEGWMDKCKFTIVLWFIRCMDLWMD